MKALIKMVSLLALFAITRAAAALPVALDLGEKAAAQTVSAWPTMPPQSLPKGLRPCCAFGYNLHAELLGMPVPIG